MSERDRQRQREGGGDDVDIGTDSAVGTDFDALGGATDDPLESPQPVESSGVRTRVREGARTVATPRSLGVALVAVTAGLLVLGGLLPLGSIGNLLGLAAGAFLYGVASEVRHYTETTAAGALAGGVSALLGNLALTATGIGVPLVAVGAVGGGLAGLVGHYFGRDLRDGLTRDV